MRTALLLPLGALLLVGALPARAADTFVGPEGIEYPADVGYATRADSEPIVTPEITYEGARGVVVKADGVTRTDFLAESDLGTDVQLPAAPAARPSAVLASPEKLACDCPCHHHG